MAKIVLNYGPNNSKIKTTKGKSNKLARWNLRDKIYKVRLRIQTVCYQLQGLIYIKQYKTITKTLNEPITNYIVNIKWL